MAFHQFQPAGVVGFAASAAERAPHSERARTYNPLAALCCALSFVFAFVLSSCALSDSCLGLRRPQRQLALNAGSGSDSDSDSNSKVYQQRCRV